jgi:methionine-rich copper-binding protein CopC
LLKVKIKEATSQIRMHAYDLNMTAYPIISMVGSSGGPMEFDGFVKSNDDKHFLDLIYKSNLKVGEYKLTLTFVGRLNDDLEGFYRSSYTTANGKQK